MCPERKTAFAHKMASFMDKSDQFVVACMLSFRPHFGYDYNFDAPSLWEGVEVNPIGSKIIWGSMFAYYDTAKALEKKLNVPYFWLLVDTIISIQLTYGKSIEIAAAISQSEFLKTAATHPIRRKRKF